MNLEWTEELSPHWENCRTMRVRIIAVREVGNLDMADSRDVNKCVFSADNKELIYGHAPVPEWAHRRGYSQASLDKKAGYSGTYTRPRDIGLDSFHDFIWSNSDTNKQNRAPFGIRDVDMTGFFTGPRYIGQYEDTSSESEVEGDGEEVLSAGALWYSGFPKAGEYNTTVEGDATMASVGSMNISGIVPSNTLASPGGLTSTQNEEDVTRSLQAVAHFAAEHLFGSPTDEDNGGEDLILPGLQDNEAGAGLSIGEELLGLGGEPGGGGVEAAGHGGEGSGACGGGCVSGGGPQLARHDDGSDHSGDELPVLKCRLKLLFQRKKESLARNEAIRIANHQAELERIRRVSSFV